MNRNGSYLSLVVSPFVSVWNTLYFVFVTLFWSKLFGTKRRKVTRSQRYQVIRSSNMASRSPRDRRPCKSQNSVDESDEGLPGEIVSLRAHHKQAYGYIAKALEIDEEGGENAELSLRRLLSL